MKKTRISENGQALILIVLAMIGLIGITAVSVDGGLAYLDRRNAQNAADAAALATALTKIRSGDWHASGLARAASNGYDNNNTSNIVNVYQCTNNRASCGIYQGNAEYYQVIIISHLKTLFAPVVGVSEITNQVNAIAHAAPGVRTSMWGGPAIAALDPDGCKALTYNGNSNVTITGSGLYVNSICQNGAFFNNSSSPNTALTAPCLQAVGKITYASGSLNIPQNCIIEDAPRQTAPIQENIDCGSKTAKKTGDTLSPGNWDGPFPPNGVINLKSGVYCVSNGNFQLNGGDELHGHGVTISIRDGFVKWNGGATIDLQAPITGTYQGLLLSLPPSNSSPVTINGNGDSQISGSIKAPSSEVTIEGGGGATGLQTQIIGFHVTLSGTSDLLINYDANLQYHPPRAPTIQLTR